jgi:hypothetical protein
MPCAVAHQCADCRAAVVVDTQEQCAHDKKGINQNEGNDCGCACRKFRKKKGKDMDPPTPDIKKKLAKRTWDGIVSCVPNPGVLKRGEEAS